MPNKTNMTNDYFSKEAVNNMKGLFAIMVLVHHIFMKVLVLPEGSVAEFVTHHFGYWAVSAFFFFSGYGLMVSSKKEGYRDSFLRNRVLPIFLINVALVAVYTLEKVVLNIPFTYSKVLASLFIGETVVNFGWFMQIIVIFYLLFCLSSYFNKRSTEVLMLLIVLYVVVCMSLHLNDYYYLSSFSFPLGAYFCKYKERTDNNLCRIGNLTPVVTGLLFVIIMSVLYLLQTGMLRMGYLSLPLYFIEGPVLMCFVVAFMKTVVVDSCLLAFCGSISFAVYVMQGFVYNLLRNGFWIVEDKVIAAIIWFAGTIIIAYLTQPVLNKIMKMVRK